MKLYELPMEFDAISLELEMCNGEITPELEQRMREALEGGADKIDAAAAVVRQLEAQSKMLKDEATRMGDRAKSTENNADRLRALMLNAVDAGFGGKVKTPRFTVWGQTSAPTINVDVAPGIDIKTLPADLLRFKDPELNKAAIKEAFEAGIVLPDELLITPQPGKRSLRIK